MPLPDAPDYSTIYLLSQLNAGLFTADAAGRGKFVAGFFGADAVSRALFAAGLFDAATAASIFAAGAIPYSRLNVTGALLLADLATAAKARSLPFGHAGAGTISNVAAYFPAGGYVDLTNGTAANAGAPCPWTGVIDEIHLKLGLAVTAGHTLTATVYVDGVAKALVVAIVNADGLTVKATLGAAVAVNKDQLVCVELVKDTAGAQALKPLGYLRIIPSGA